MAVQTSYSTQMANAFAGMKFDLNDDGDVVDAAINTEDSASIPFGVFVASDSSSDDGAKLMSGSTDDILGVVLFSQNYARTYTAPDGTVIGQLDADGLVPGVAFGVMRKGRVYVKSEAAAAKGDPVWVRYSANSPNLQVGAVTNADDTGHTVQVAGKYVRSCGAGDIVPIDFDTTVAPIS